MKYSPPRAPASREKHIGGFTIIQAPDLDAALEWGAAGLPGGITLPIEVRTLQGRNLRVTRWLRPWECEVDLRTCRSAAAVLSVVDLLEVGSLVFIEGVAGTFGVAPQT